MPPKEKDKKPESGNLNPIEWLILVIIFLTVLSTLIPNVIRFFSSGDFTFYGFEIPNVVSFFKNHLWFFKILGITVAGVAAIGTFIFNQKANAIWKTEKDRLNLNPKNMPASLGDKGPTVDPLAEKWKKILEYSESENSSDWRLAIIEADIMLDDLLRQLQLPGDTMGEKLKAVEKSDFNTIEMAWEAHKARNMIAHEGSDFLLNQREVCRIISLYEAVFKEFRII